MAYKYDISGFKKLEKRLQRAPKEKLLAIDGVLKKHVTKINEVQVQRVPKDRGEIAQDTGFRQNTVGDYSLFSNAPHALFMEFGTGDYYTPIPGVTTPTYTKGDAKNETGKTLFQLIHEWVKRTGIAGRFSVKTRQKLNSIADKEREYQAAWAIYRHIREHGVRPHAFFFGPFIEGRKALLRDVVKELKEI